MRIKTLMSVVAVVMLGLFASACGTTDYDISSTAPAPYQGQATATGGSLIQQLQKAGPKAKPTIVFAVGACDDKTGKFLDNDQLRYSRAVTQACRDIIANYLKMAGFQVAERDPYNLGLINHEYEMSHTFGPAQPCPPAASGKQPAVPCTAGSPVNIGLIQRNGLNGGLTGANVLVTGAITAYDSSETTGGGGAAYDGMGISTQKSTAIVGITLRFVDMATGLVISSLDEQTKVTGTSVDLHLTRFLGDVATSLATIAGGGGAATIIAPQSNTHVLSAELGGAMQAPIDYAVTDAIVASITRQLEVNQSLFYTKAVKFDYNLPTD
jgi:curli biogenesis system outer membrane secretion channel CsgG